MAQNDRKKTYPNRVRFSFAGSVENIRLFAHLGRKLVEQIWPKEEEFAFEVEMCLVEALSNVFFHAHLEEAWEIIFCLCWNANELAIKVYDRGPGFELEKALKMTEDDLLLEHGRGVKIMAALVDQIFYLRGRQLNCLYLRKCVHKKPETVRE